MKWNLVAVGTLAALILLGCSGSDGDGLGDAAQAACAREIECTGGFAGLNVDVETCAEMLSSTDGQSEQCIGAWTSFLNCMARTPCEATVACDDERDRLDNSCSDFAL